MFNLPKDNLRSKFYKEHLEVTVAIKDTNESAVEEFFEGQAGQLAAKIREGAVNPDAPRF
jgi:hypothetical protein